MRRLLLLVLMSVEFVRCFGQFLPDTLWTEEFGYRVKQLDEFMRRFNQEEYLSIDVADSLKKEVNLLYLFNRDLFSEKKDSMKEEVDKFILTVLERDVRLNFEDGAWFAEVICNCVYEGTKQEVTLFLKPEKTENELFRWVIIGAKGNILKLDPPKRNRGLDILPNNHEVAFMALPKISVIGGKYVLNYARKEFTPNLLTAFYALVYSGKLEIETTQKIIYHFLQVPGYVFNVERFMRDGNNTGWLISKLTFICEIEKQTYLKKILK